MSKPTKILFVIDYYHPHLGGLEIVFDNIIRRLLDQGYHIGIITTRHMSTLSPYEEYPQLNIWRVGSSRNNFVWYGFRKTLSLAANYDLIHTTTYAGALPASLAGRLRGKKVLITIHEIFDHLRYQYKRFGRLYKLYEWVLFQLPYTCYVAVSHYTKQMIHDIYQIPLHKIEVVYNGIDTSLRNSRFHDTAWIEQFKRTHQLKHKRCLLYYGHSGASKGLDYLIQALPQLKKSIPDIHLIINLLPRKRDHKILELISNLQLRSSITLLHGVRQRDLLNLIYLAAATVVPSVSEGFGLTAAEVSQLQQPIIVTKNGALPEVVSGKVVFLDGYDSSDFLHAVKKIRTADREHIPHKLFDRDQAVQHYQRLYHLESGQY